MACAVATEINILDPDILFLGGGVLSMKGFPRKMLLKKLGEKTRKTVGAAALKIIFSGQEDPYNGAHGAALYAYAHERAREAVK